MTSATLTPGQGDALQALLQRPRVARLFAALDGNGEELRIVGGAVRDALLGLPVTEIDLAATSTPEQTTARARRAGLKSVPTGVDHGTVTVIVDREPFEITTLREDVETDGRRAQVRFGRDFDADALRRDFTINAMSLDGQGRLHDPAGGLTDLGDPAGGRGPRVRFIGDATTRIREDYLRTLRFFRFHARFGQDAPDPDGFAAAIACRDGLDQLSRERVRAELLKLLAAPGAAEAITLMSGAGLLHRVSGIVAEPGRLERLIVREDRHGAAADALLRLAAAAVRVAEDARALQERLRLSGAEAMRLGNLARAQERLHCVRRLSLASARAMAAELGGEALTDAVALVDGAPWFLAGDNARDYVAALAAGAAAPVFPLRGADLLALGVTPGPAVGAMMAALRTHWLDAGCPEGAAARAGLLAHATDMAAG